MTNSLLRKGLSATKYTVAFRIIAQGIGAFATICLVRLLSEHDYGIYNLLYSFIPLMGMVFSFGIANTLQRYIPEYYSRGEYKIAHRLYKTASIIRLISNVAVLGGILLLWDYAGPLLKLTEYKTYFALFCLIVILHRQRSILDTCLSSYFLQKYSQGISIVFVAIKGVGYVFALWFSWDIWFVIIIDLVAYLITFGLLEFIYYEKIPRAGGTFPDFPADERKRITRYALFYNFNDAGVGLLNADFDNFIIVMYLNPIAVGAYSFCYRITKMAEQILPTNYLLQVIQPLFFSSNIVASPDQTNRKFQLLVKITYIFQVPLFCFFLLFSRECISILFEGKFQEYYLILIAISFVSLLNAFQSPVGLVAQLIEKADIILYSKIFAVYNLIADVIFIHYLGLWGAVLATGSATLGKNIFIWFFVRDAARFHGMAPFFLRLLGYWAIVIIFGLFFKTLISSDLIVFFVGACWLCLASWFQLRFVHLKKQEQELLSLLGSESPKIALLLRLSGLGYDVVRS